MTAELSAAVSAVKAISNQQTSVNQHSAFCEKKSENLSEQLWRKKKKSQSRKKKTTTPQRRRNYAKPKQIVNK